MRFIDTHSHLYDEVYGQEQDAATDRAVLANVTKIIVPDIDSTTREAMFNLTDRHPGILFPCLGIHPTSVNSDTWKTELDLVEKESTRKVWAIGEIGIDCYWSKDFLTEQIEVFRTLLSVANEKKLPVIIHSRDSTEITLKILKEFRHTGIKGVFHAFSGSYETFKEIEKLGDWYVGIGGVLTFKKASIAETIRHIPLERIILETDAPYLTPVPFRGKRNESAYIPHIASKLAELKGTDINTVAEQTTLNAESLFQI